MVRISFGQIGNLLDEIDGDGKSESDGALSGLLASATSAGGAMLHFSGRNGRCSCVWSGPKGADVADGGGRGRS